MPTLPVLACIANYVRDAGLTVLEIAGALTPAPVNGAWIFNTDVIGTSEAPITLYGHATYTTWCGDYLLCFDGTQLTLTDGAATPATLFTSTTLTGAYTPVAQSAGSGPLLVTSHPITWGERQGNIPQMVLTAFSTHRYTDRDMYATYPVQCDCFHTNRQVAEMWSLAVKNFFNPFESSSSTAPGLAMNGYAALQVHVEHKGVIELMGAVNATQLYRAVTLLYLTNLERM